MYVGVIATFFMFSNFYQLDDHNKSHVALVNVQWNIWENWIENGTLI